MSPAEPASSLAPWRSAEHTSSGVDLSENMLAIAQHYEQEQPLGIAYLRDDAHSLAGLTDACCDAVTCCLALTDIPDPLEEMAAAVARILRPGGRFVYALPHPCTQAPGSGWYQVDEQKSVALVQGYFNEGPWSSDTQFSGRLGGVHRMLSTLLTVFTANGLPFERSVEPQAFHPQKPGYSEVPVAFVARHRKGGPQ